jgi:ferredoxin-NADP reductase
VRHVAPATPRTRIISLDVSATRFAFSAGQAVMLGLRASPLRKPYSIASAPFEVARTGQLQVLAQVDDTGGPDPHLELAAPGTLIDLDGPFGEFGLPSPPTEGLLFVAGGTGIAPLRSMIIERLTSAAAEPMALVYSARAREEFAFMTELDALRATGRLSVHVTVTRTPDTGWSGRRGRIDQTLLRDALPSPRGYCLICGPTQLITDATELLRKLGVSDGRILTEKY